MRHDDRTQWPFQPKWFYDSIVLYLPRQQYNNTQLQFQSMSALLKLSFHINCEAGSPFPISQNWGGQQCANFLQTQKPQRLKHTEIEAQRSYIDKRNKCPAFCQQHCWLPTAITGRRARLGHRDHWGHTKRISVAQRQLEIDTKQQLSVEHLAQVCSPPHSGKVQTSWLRAASSTVVCMDQVTKESTPYWIWRGK